MEKRIEAVVLVQKLVSGQVVDKQEKKQIVKGFNELDEAIQKDASLLPQDILDKQMRDEEVLSRLPLQDLKTMSEFAEAFGGNMAVKVMDKENVDTYHASALLMGCMLKWKADMEMVEGRAVSAEEVLDAITQAAEEAREAEEAAANSETEAVVDETQR